jgi:Tfp pilus assembly protein PilO
MSETNEPKPDQTEIVRNEFDPHDPTVVVEEPDRTVVLTDEETIVIQKTPTVDIAPKNRPRRVNLGMWGTSEIVAVALGALSLVAAFLFYMFVVSPAQSQLSARQAERDRLQRELDTANDRFRGFTTTQDEVVKLVQSVEDFETRHLPVADFGRTALYQRLNTLIGNYGLVNTSGPDYAPLLINERQGQGENERGRSKFQSLFPGVYVTVTLEGSYQNLRRFIRDVETGSQFVIVSAVQLEPTENQSQAASQTATVSQPDVSNPNQPYARPNNLPPGINPAGINQPFGNPSGGFPDQTTAAPQNKPRPRGKTVGEVVSLRIELAAYFKRGASALLQPQQQ